MGVIRLRLQAALVGECPPRIPDPCEKAVDCGRPILGQRPERFRPERVKPAHSTRRRAVRCEPHEGRRDGPRAVPKMRMPTRPVCVQTMSSRVPRASTRVSLSAMRYLH